MKFFCGKIYTWTSSTHVNPHRIGSHTSIANWVFLKAKAAQVPPPLELPLSYGRCSLTVGISTALAHDQGWDVSRKGINLFEPADCVICQFDFTEKFILPNVQFSLVGRELVTTGEQNHRACSHFSWMSASQMHPFVFPRTLSSGDCRTDSPILTKFPAHLRISAPLDQAKGFLLSN